MAARPHLGQRHRTRERGPESTLLAGGRFQKDDAWWGCAGGWFSTHACARPSLHVAIAA